MTSSKRIASGLYHIALALFVLLQASHAGAAALRMELNSTLDGVFVVICTPNGTKTVALSEVSADRSQTSHECECPGATLCGQSVLAPPADSGALLRALPSRTGTLGPDATSTLTADVQPKRPGSPRSPPSPVI